MKKVIVSPGYGAGWATWNNHGKFIAEYPALVEFIENATGEEKARLKTEWDTSDGTYKVNYIHPIIEQLQQEIAEKFSEDIEGISLYTGGLPDAVVVTVNGDYMIEEYDGFESVLERDNAEWW